MIKLLSDKQIFASQMPDFAAARAIMAATHKILSTTCAILDLTWFCHLSMKPRGGGLRSPEEVEFTTFFKPFPYLAAFPTQSFNALKFTLLS